MATSSSKKKERRRIKFRHLDFDGFRLSSLLIRGTTRKGERVCKDNGENKRRREDLREEKRCALIEFKVNIFCLVLQVEGNLLAADRWIREGGRGDLK
jgi:hypothetical protein